MEAFSLLKYWKAAGGGGGVGGVTRGGAMKHSVTNSVTPTTIVAAVSTDDDSLSDGGDDGPFFDLEFAVPADVDNEHEEVELRQKVEKRETIMNEINEDDEVEVVEEEEVVQRLSFSPSDDLFFKGRILQIDGSDLTDENNGGGGGGKSGQIVSLVKSAAKFRVFMLGLKRSKSESKQVSSENSGGNNNSNSNSNNSSKFMTVKLRMEDVKVPIISLLTRASSNSKLKNTTTATTTTVEAARSSEECGENEKRINKKEVVQRYLKMVKPLYVKLPRKNNQDTTAVVEDATAELKDEKTAERKVKVASGGGGRKGLSLKAVIAKKHLGKSKSAVVHSMPNNNDKNGNNGGSNNQSNNKSETTSSKKRDDSLLQQQDGIQSAILHCKRSFNSSSSSSQDGDDTVSVLTRSVSDPLHVKNVTVEVVVVQAEERNGVVEGVRD